MSDVEQAQPVTAKRRFGFLRGVGRGFTVFRNLVLNVLFLVILIIVLVAIFSDDDIKAVPENAVLNLNPAGSLVDQSLYDDPILDFLIGPDLPIDTTINDVLNVLDHAAQDRRIQLVVLDFSRLFDVDFAETERIQNAILELRESGTEVWAHANSYSQGSYLLAMAADRVLMDPLGEFTLSGVSASRVYYHGLLNKLNIDVNVYAEGEYKTAVEPYLRSDMSDAARQINTHLVDSLWTRMKARIAEIRNIDESRIDEYANELHSLLSASDRDAAELAVDFKFVDALVTKSEIDDEYRENIDESLTSIKFYDYLQHVPTPRNFGQPRIAVVVVQGDILGVQSELTGRTSSWVNQIESVRKDRGYRGLVLRVNSPGGSVYTSENIRRALVKYKKTDRPLVASFAGTAASGGYWAALPADEIFATPVTLTGSIGVFGLYPNVDNALTNIGITNDVIRSTPYGLSDSLTVTPTDATHTLRAQMVKRHYDRFVKLVANAREHPVEYIEERAQGRVWLGEDALDEGLVDQLGELEAAIARTAELANLSEYDVVYVKPSPSAQTPLGLLLSELREAFVRTTFPMDLLARPLNEIKYLRDPSHAYARCSACGLNFAN